MQDQLEGLFAKAGRSFDAAEGLLRDGHPDFAASRAYYGCFYIAEALLLSEGQSYSRHSQVVAQFGRRFAKTGELDRRYHRLLIESFELRQTADYSASPEAVSEEDAELTSGRVASSSPLLVTTSSSDRSSSKKPVFAQPPEIIWVQRTVYQMIYG